MAFELEDAKRSRSFFRGALIGPSGVGKSYSALRLAFGISETGSVAMIDTENRSGALYAKVNKDGIGKWKHGVILPPYTVSKYGEAIDACVDAGIEVIIIDSLSHAWAGSGGLLEKKGNIEAKTGNGWTAWREPTRDHLWLLEKILATPAHIICTVRAKMEFVQDRDQNTGKTVVRKVGMQPVQRDGLEFEFTSVIDMNQDHSASCSKDRTGIFDGKFFPLLTEDHGRQIREWFYDSEEEPAITQGQTEELKSLLESRGKKLKKPISSYTQEEAEGVISTLKAMRVEEVAAHSS